MKIDIDQIDKKKCYAARLLRLSDRYGFEREFLEETRRKIRSVKGEPQRTRYSYRLSDGLYEICESENRRYLAVVNNRSIPLETADLETAMELCKGCDYDFTQLYAQWVDSRKRSSKSFVAIAESVSAQYETERRERESHEAIQRREHKKRGTENRRQRLSTMTVSAAFDGSDGADTRAFLKRLEKVGVDGPIAAQLFRCQKPSTRAKVYRGDYQDMAYERKGDAIKRLCEMLENASNLKWGWKYDPTEDYAAWVLYVELPTGQVSFHSPVRFDGPDYAGEWDRQHESKSRILAYCQSVLSPNSIAT